MRIIAGTHRGRRIVAPQGDATRPTTDRVRESLFSSLVSHAGPALGGGPVLDAFAGSGALGLEALSRGAGPVTFVESGKAAQAALAANIKALGFEHEALVRRGDVFALARRGLSGPFALILLDPPYTLDAARVSGLLSDLRSSGAVAYGALISWEHAAGQPVLWPPGFLPVAAKGYGTSAVDIARYEGEGETR